MNYIATYKAPGRLTDKVVRAALSVRHGEPVIYSHVELLKGAPYYRFPGMDILVQDSIAASKRDNEEVRLVPNMFFKPGHWDFFSLPVDDDLELWEQALTLLGKSYDIEGAALCITPWARLSIDKEWCSGMIADMAGWDDPETYDPFMVTRKALALGGCKVTG